MVSGLSGLDNHKIKFAFSCLVAAGLRKPRLKFPYVLTYLKYIQECVCASDKKNIKQIFSPVVSKVRDKIKCMRIMHVKYVTYLLYVMYVM